MTQITSIIQAVNYINSPSLATGLEKFQWQRINYETVKWFKDISRTADVTRQVEKLLADGKLAGTVRSFDTLLDNTWTSPNDLSTVGFQEVQYQRNPVSVSPILVSKTVFQASDAVRMASQDGTVTDIGFKMIADAMYKMSKELLEKLNAFYETSLPTLISTGGGIYTDLYAATGDYLSIPALSRPQMYEGMITTADGNYMNTNDLRILGNTLIGFETMTNYLTYGTQQSKDTKQFYDLLTVNRSNSLAKVDPGDYSVAYMAQGGVLGVHEFLVNNYSYPEAFTTADVEIAAVTLPKIFSDVPDIKATFAIKKVSKDNSGTLLGSFGQWSYLDTQVEMYMATQPVIIPAVTPNAARKGIIGFVIE